MLLNSRIGAECTAGHIILALAGFTGAINAFSLNFFANLSIFIALFLFVFTALAFGSDIPSSSFGQTFSGHSGESPEIACPSAITQLITSLILENIYGSLDRVQTSICSSGGILLPGIVVRRVREIKSDCSAKRSSVRNVCSEEGHSQLIVWTEGCYQNVMSLAVESFGVSSLIRTQLLAIIQATTESVERTLSTTLPNNCPPGALPVRNPCN
jgi:hypothetical protein